MKEKKRILDNGEDFKVDVVSVRLVKEAGLYFDHALESPDEVVSALGDIMCEFDREVIAVINMQTDGRLINVTFASMGALNSAVAHPRELLKASILSNAANILLLHSHPSGSLSPSKDDTKLTDKMIQVCNLIGIPLLDHIIVGGDNREYFSFKEKGVLGNPYVKLKTDYREINFPNVIVAEKGKAR